MEPRIAHSSSLMCALGLSLAILGPTLRFVHSTFASEMATYSFPHIAFFQLYSFAGNFGVLLSFYSRNGRQRVAMTIGLLAGCYGALKLLPRMMGPGDGEEFTPLTTWMTYMVALGTAIVFMVMQEMVVGSGPVPRPETEVHGSEKCGDLALK